MRVEQKKKVVLGLLEALNKGDVSGALDLLAEDLTWWAISNFPYVSEMYNKQEMMQIFEKTPDLSVGRINFILDHLIAEGDYVAAEFRAEMKIPKRKVYQTRYHFKFEVKDGKIKEVRAY